MKGTIYKRFHRGVRLEKLERVGDGDFNLLPGPPLSGRAENDATFHMPGGAGSAMSEARVVTVAGFGMLVAGLERIRAGKEFAHVQQEWWFAPQGHDDIPPEACR
ncbi:hypothetical protein [Methylibium petroleiphilum]|uniref:Uncharacterized protein n=1 Tax=Methylibium petroleiphilum (strain ATCC BAA-1232 / LMG 22953 / PM1) TaxID=420662 RepID=A2SN65_METPP|nr:hypothetical protein [Methylibium petroleiphilum]ABM97004.1 hypothetical protein Mpe_B0229 [Methylibium petroleiphilum PM1]